MWRMIFVVLSFFILQNSWAIPQDLLGLEKLTDDKIYSMTSKMIKSCNSKLKDKIVSNDEKFKQRVIKDLLDRLPLKKTNREGCTRLKLEFMSDYRIPTTADFDKLLTSRQKVFLRIFDRLCSKKK